VEQVVASVQARLFVQTSGEPATQLPAWLQALVVSWPPLHDGVPHDVDGPGYWQVPLASQPVAAQVAFVDGQVPEQQWALGGVPRQRALAQLPPAGGVEHDWPSFRPHDVLLTHE
jgi:hypothetical protein